MYVTFQYETAEFFIMLISFIISGYFYSKANSQSIPLERDEKIFLFVALFIASSIACYLINIVVLAVFDWS